ncbi:HEPN-associated N-terminal domain-containing protein [Streptomyces noursei]|uniref:HEPN-associated N-terminal domain-containing protein n=1 Tax=Streptomyces noursei TaxID=1971 RepID=UPI003809A19C
MNQKLSGQVTLKLRELVSNYQSRGYSVVAVEDDPAIPQEIVDLQPDLVVRRGNEYIFVELKGGARPSLFANHPHLANMAATVDRFPNWKMELHWLGDPPAQRISLDQVNEVLSRARAVATVDSAAALLLGWSAAEVALDRRIRSIQHDDSPNAEGRQRVRSPKQLVSLAQSLGLISDDIYETLLKAGDARNRLAHGFHVDGVSDLPQLTESLLDATRRLSLTSYASPDEMIDWFRENYEDPAESVPYDSREGGYQYFGVSPHDARDVLQDQFPGASQEDIDEAVEILERESVEWVSRWDH